MKVGDLVRTMQNRAPWKKVAAIITGEDPKSLHGPGWWVMVPSTGEILSRHPGDLEVISESR